MKKGRSAAGVTTPANLGLTTLVLAIAGCGGGDLGPMSGTQALQGRDFENLFFWTSHTLTFTRDTADPSSPMIGSNHWAWMPPAVA